MENMRVCTQEIFISINISIKRGGNVCAYLYSDFSKGKMNERKFIWILRGEYKINEWNGLKSLRKSRNGLKIYIKNCAFLVKLYISGF